MSILEQWEELKRNVDHNLDALGAKQAHMAQTWAITRSDWLFEELRKHRPILNLHKLALVTRYDDTVEVLGDEDAFSVRLYVPKIVRTSGPVLLEFPTGSLRDRDFPILEAAIRREDIPRVTEMVRDTAAELIAPHLASGELDVAADLADHVAVRVIGTYFGVPGPDDATMLKWAHQIFEDIFANLTDNDIDREEAIQAGVEWRAHMARLIRERHAAMAAGQSTPDDVMGRWLQMQAAGQDTFNDDQIPANFIGMMMGGVDSIATAIVHVLYELLQEPERLDGARQAALAGDDALLEKYTREALRFRPQSTALYRFCERTTTLARGTDRETEIEDGTTVVVMLASAMMDEDKVTDPREFRVDRPDDHYLHFGYGLHHCFGRYLARAHIQEATKAVLRLDNLRASGDIKYDGIFPTSLRVAFDPPGAAGRAPAQDA